jgi:hypothetical protein
MQNSTAPWKIVGNLHQNNGGENVSSIQTKQFAFDVIQVPALSLDMVRANISLIESAPALLQVCEGLLAACKHHKVLTGTMMFAEEVIAKAKDIGRVI